MTPAPYKGKITKAIVLAAGYGTRMQPLSDQVPKALMPLWGKPMLAHSLDLLKGWGVRDVLVNCHHQAGQVMEYIARNPVEGLSLSVSFEPEILGTGGAIRRAMWFLDDRPFWLINADVAAALQPAPLVSAFLRHRPLAVLWMHATRGPRTVEVSPDHFIQCFRSPSPGQDHTYTFCGCHLLDPRILDYLPREERFGGMVPVYEAAMAKGERVMGVTVPGAYWADVGRPGQYLDAHREVWAAYRERKPGGALVPREAVSRMNALRRKGVRVEGFAALSDQVVVRKGAQLTNVVLWEGAACQGRSHITNAIVGQGVTARGSVSDIVVKPDAVLKPRERETLKSLAWPLEQTTVQVFPARGSARSFFRLISPGKRIILIRYSTERRENAFYAVHARFLGRLGLNVPAVVRDCPRGGFLMMEDVGDRSLQVAITGRPSRNVIAWYAKVLDEVFLLHQKGATQAKNSGLPLMPAFTKHLYRREHDLFFHHFIPRRPGGRGVDTERIRCELESIAAHLAKSKRVLIHRDLQSSNILIRKGKPVFIDFQGMRLGPPAYDLASLLCDPYVELNEAVQDNLLRYYTDRMALGDGFYEQFWHGAVQRLIQALGAYGRLSGLPGCERFSRHFTPALRLLLRALERLDRCGYLHELAEKWLGNLDAAQGATR